MVDFDSNPKSPPEGWTILEAAKALCPSWSLVTDDDVAKSDIDWFLAGYSEGPKIVRRVGKLKPQLDELKALILERDISITGRPGPGHSEPIPLTKGILQTLNFYRWRDNIARDDYGDLFYRDIRICTLDIRPMPTSVESAEADEDLLIAKWRAPHVVAFMISQWWKGTLPAQPGTARIHCTAELAKWVEKRQLNGKSVPNIPATGTMLKEFSLSTRPWNRPDWKPMGVKEISKLRF